MSQVKHPIERLKATRWWKPTVRRYAAHVLAIERQGCAELRERFITFAAEVLNTPEAARDDMLAVEQAVWAEPPARRYRQYDQPTPKEMNVGTDLRRLTHGAAGRRRSGGAVRTGNRGRD